MNEHIPTPELQGGIEQEKTNEARTKRLSRLHLAGPLLLALGISVMGGASEAQAAEKFRPAALIVHELGDAIGNESLDEGIRKMAEIREKINQLEKELDGALEKEGITTTQMSAVFHASRMDNGMKLGEEQTLKYHVYVPSQATSPEFREKISAHAAAMNAYLNYAQAKFQKEFFSRPVKTRIVYDTSKN